MSDLRIEVTGLKELRSSLKRLGHVEETVELRTGLKAAAEIVAREARYRANYYSFSASDTIRAGTSGAKATVSGGKSALPWYGWFDFGSRTPVQGQPRSVGPWAHSGRGPRRGRFIYPALDAKREETTEAVAQAIDRIIEKAGLH